MKIIKNKDFEFNEDDFIWRYLDLYKFFSLIINKKLFFASLFIFISSLLYSQKITETLLFLEYNYDLDSIFVVHKEITYNPDNIIFLEEKQIQTEFELPTDSNGCPIVILQPQKKLVQQTDSTELKKQNYTDKASITQIVIFLFLAALIGIPCIIVFFQQLKRKDKHNDK